MKLVFFDEVKQQPDYPHYHIGAICIDEQHLEAIEAEINLVANDVFGDSRLSAATEFHAKDIYHRKRVFAGMVNPADRVAILERLIRILSKEEVDLIDIQINAEFLTAGQSAADIAFMFLCERVSQHMRVCRSLGMLIGDRDTDVISERFSVDLSNYRARGTDFRFGHEIDNLFESVHFTHSHLSRFLQLADIYSWVLQFKNRHRGSTDPRYKLMFDVFSKEDISLFPRKYKEWPRIR